MVTAITDHVEFTDEAACCFRFLSTFLPSLSIGSNVLLFCSGFHAHSLNAGACIVLTLNSETTLFDLGAYERWHGE